MKTVILIPRREDKGRRDMIWHRLRGWLAECHPDFMMVEGFDDSPVFSMTAARNNAARDAGDWDVAVFHDSDTFTDPHVLRSAVKQAHETDKVVVAGDTRLEMDRQASDHMLINGWWFPTTLPTEDDPCHLSNFYASTQLLRVTGGHLDKMQHQPTSGAVAVSRSAWERIGGFLGCLQGWGHDDIIFLKCAEIFAEGVAWESGPILHFFHERTPRSVHTSTNFTHWQILDEISRQPDAAHYARWYLDHLAPKLTETWTQ